MNKGEAIKILNSKAMNTVGILNCLDPNCSEAKALWREIDGYGNGSLERLNY